MIVFDLGCDRGHVFEAWFGSTGDFEEQRARGLISCPICDSQVVDKAVMAPRIGRKGNQLAIARGPASPPASGEATVPVASDGPSPEQAKAMLAALAKAQAEVLKDSDFVGTRFAQEARAMHAGEAEHRAIYGQTSPAEAKALIEEGVPVSPLPLPVRLPGTDN